MPSSYHGFRGPLIHSCLASAAFMRSGVVLVASGRGRSPQRVLGLRAPKHANLTSSSRREPENLAGEPSSGMDIDEAEFRPIPASFRRPGSAGAHPVHLASHAPGCSDRFSPVRAGCATVVPASSLSVLRPSGFFKPGSGEDGHGARWCLAVGRSLPSGSRQRWERAPGQIAPSI